MQLTTVGREVWRGAKKAQALVGAGAGDPTVQAHLQKLKQVEAFRKLKVDWSEIQSLVGISRATFEGLRRLDPERRPFVLTRSGFAGVQKYAWVWTGDNSSCYEHLEMSLPMLLNLGLSGVPFVGADIGGFSGDADGELLCRWTWLGAFYPFMRNHSGKGSRRQEPWAFGEKWMRCVREAIRFRYRLFLTSTPWPRRPPARAFPFCDRCFSIGPKTPLQSRFTTRRFLGRPCSWPPPSAPDRPTAWFTCPRGFGTRSLPGKRTARGSTPPLRPWRASPFTRRRARPSLSPSPYPIREALCLGGGSFGRWP